MAYYVDYHTHSNYSSDGSVSMEEMVLSGIEKGLKEIAITDHVDLDYPPVDYYIGGEFDFGQYQQERLALRQKYADKIHIVCGLEMGLQARSKEEIDAFFDEKALDFIIGSSHCVEFKDLYDGSFFVGKPQKEAYRIYFEAVYQCVKVFDCFDVYGHLDFVNRYGDYPNKTLNYQDYSDIIDEILTLLIQKGKGIEVNTSGFRYGLSAPHPQWPIIQRYRQLGGEIITTGSDAHFAKDIASHFDCVYSQLKEIGFKAIATYRERKPVFIDLP